MPDNSYVASKTFLPTTSTTNIAIAADNASITAGNTINFLTDTYFPESLNNPTNLGMRISISSADNINASVFTIVGTTPSGAALTATVTGVNNNTVSTMCIKFCSISFITRRQDATECYKCQRQGGGCRINR